MIASVDDQNSLSHLPSKMINLASLHNVVVFDAKGKPRQFADFYQKSTAVIIFLRNFLDYIAIDYARDLAKVKDFLMTKDVSLVPIGCGPCIYIKEFEDLTGLRPIFSDPERILYTNLELRTSTDHVNPGSHCSPHVHTNIVTGVIRGTLRAMRSMEFQGDPHQHGGTLIIRPLCVNRPVASGTEPKVSVRTFHKKQIRTLTTVHICAERYAMYLDYSNPKATGPISCLLPFLAYEVVYFHRERSPYDHVHIKKLLEILNINHEDFVKTFVEQKRKRKSYFITPNADMHSSAIITL